MAIDNAGPNLSALKTADLKLLIQRHEDRGATDRPLYSDAKKELSRRSSGQLNVQTTLDHLLKCAKNKAFTTYGAVAEANGVEWRIARRPMPHHLEQILEECFARGWPLLSALCVNATEVKTGELSGQSLDGFIAGTERVTKTKIDSPRMFLKKTQRDCFDRAEKL
jgi:hypothetical protein